MLLNKIKGITAVFAISILFSLAAFNLRYQYHLTSTDEIQYILDAGHGIPDGGAIGADGTTEQELNLALTLKISDKLNKKMISHVLTRSDENSIFTEGETIHAKKVSDIRNRIAVADETPEIPLISIHMNSYPDSTVEGIQVFYSADNEEAKKIAESLQLAFNTKIQPENTKTVKTISKNIYLFSHVRNPAILIECGFVSNSRELAALKTEEYQEKLSDVIAEVLVMQE